jgi:hypothetical protein
MRPIAVLAAVAAVLSSLPAPADAQTRRRAAGEPLVLQVRPRSFLNAGPVVETGSLNRVTSGYAQTQSYLASPPYIGQRERFGEGVLPDPVLNGPFVGARNPFGPVDWPAPPGLAR